MTTSFADPAAAAEGTPAAQSTDDTPPSAPPRSLTRTSIWALANYASSQGIRLGSNLILWRLLSPHAFGQMALVNAFIAGLSMFTDIGIGLGVVQHQRGEDPRFLNTVWTLQVMRGLLIAAVAALGAIPLGRFYGEPALPSLVLLVALGTAFSAFNSTNLHTASRRMLLRRIAVIDMSSQLAGAIVTIVWAYITRSVWALAGGAAVFAVLRLGLTHWAMPGVRNRFGWDRSTVDAISHFGRWVFISTLLTFFASYSDRLIFGKLTSVEMLGMYSVAAVWATMPTFIAAHLIQSVLFPLFSRVKGIELERLFTRLRGNILLAAGWLVGCLIAGGPTLIRFLYDQRAVDAGPIVQLLAIGTWFAALENANGAAVLSVGNVRWIAVGNAAKLVAMLALMPVAAILFGFRMTVLALSLTEVARYVVSLRACAVAGLHPLRQDVRLTVAVGASALLGLGVRFAYRAVALTIPGTRVDAFVEGTAILLAITAFWLLVFAARRRRSQA